MTTKRTVKFEVKTLIGSGTVTVVESKEGKYYEASVYSVKGNLIKTRKFDLDTNGIDFVMNWVV